MVSQSPPSVAVEPSAPRLQRLAVACWLTVGAAAYLVVRAGVGSYPGLAIMLDITRQLPTIPELAPLAQVFQFALLGPLLAFVLGIETAAAYQAVHVVVLVVGALVLVHAIARRWSSDVALLSAAAFVASPAAAVTVAWTGSYDVFTLLLGSAVVVARTRWVAAAAGFLAAFAAFEQVAISLVLLIGVAALLGDLRDRRYVAGLVGAVAGRLVLTVVLAANGVTHDRRHWLEHFGYEHFLDQFRDALPVLLLTAFGGAWVIVVLCLAAGTTGWRERATWIVALALPLVPTAITEDQTRVFAVLTWPIVLALVIRTAPALGHRRVLLGAGGALVLGLVVPAVFLWRGQAFLAEHHLWHVVTG